MKYHVRSWADRTMLFTWIMLVGCDPFHVEFDDVEPAGMYERSKHVNAPTPEETLRVMSYNVKFGGGRIDFFFDCHGDRVLMNEDEVIQNLERVIKIINTVDPDVLLLEEVDVNSKRSAYVDQLQWILEHTHLNYAAYGSQWRADFVPSDGLGPVDSGTAILSRWPLRNAKRYALALREDQNAIVQYFYLQRNILEASIDVGDESVSVIAIHAEAYSQDGTKRKHIEAFEQHVDEAAGKGMTIAGGDLNTLPPGSKKLKGFADSACEGEFLADDFSQETHWLDNLYEHYESAIPLAAYEVDNTPYFSHTTSKDGFWNRTLDYLFSNRPLRDGRVLQGETGGIEAMNASDHAPLVVEMDIAQ
jgi:endonuclease/exonuclease/phosphatase family metal-dependent hydrolase